MSAPVEPVLTEEKKLPTRTILNFDDDKSNHIDSSAWNNFPYRDGDIIVATYAKSGTTWTGQILHQLLNGGIQQEESVHQLMPWLDVKLMGGVKKNLEYVESIPKDKRRTIKTHLPLNAIEYSPKARYIYIVRNGMDTALSLHNHHNAFSDLARQALTVGPKVDWDTFFHRFLYEDCKPYWSYWKNIQSWYDYKHCENILLIHFEELKADLPGSIRKIAKHCNIKIPDEETFNLIVSHCTFDYMKKNEHLFSPPEAFMEKGAFINKGETGRYKQLLTEKQREEYFQVCKQQFTPECEQWLNQYVKQ